MVRQNKPQLVNVVVRIKIDSARRLPNCSKGQRRRPVRVFVGRHLDAANTAFAFRLANGFAGNVRRQSPNVLRHKILNLVHRFIQARQRELESLSGTATTSWSSWSALATLRLLAIR